MKMAKEMTAYEFLVAVLYYFSRTDFYFPNIVRVVCVLYERGCKFSTQLVPFNHRLKHLDQAIIQLEKQGNISKFTSNNSFSVSDSLLGSFGRQVYSSLAPHQQNKVRRVVQVLREIV